MEVNNMKEWLETGMHQVNALLGKDADFQELLEQLTVALEKYQSVMDRLPQEEKEIIEDYIALCEEVEYQKTHTAYYCGKRNR
jgi:hypothetical protein